MNSQCIASIKNNIFQNYIIFQENETHKNLQKSTLMKRTKQNYSSKYFESNLTDIKNTWKRIKSIIFMRSSSSITPTLLNFRNETIDNPKKIQTFSTIISVLLAKRPKLKENIQRKITLITSRMKTLNSFSSQQQTKKKLN